MSGDISHSQGPQDKPRRLWNGSRLPEIMPPPQQEEQFPAELPKAWWYPSVHGHVVARDPAGVRILICVSQEDQDASRYSAKKAVLQHEMSGWQVGHRALPLPGLLRGTGWVREGGGSTLRRKHN